MSHQSVTDGFPTASEGPEPPPDIKGPAVVGAAASPKATWVSLQHHHTPAGGLVQPTDDPFAIPEFLIRANVGRPYKPRRRTLTIPASMEVVPAKWSRAGVAVVDCFPPLFPEHFPCGRRRVRFLVRPRKRKVEVRAGTGEIAIIDERAFAKARAL